MTEMSEARQAWDFFVSYTEADQVWAEWIAWILEEIGYKVLIQAWDFVPGTHWILRMHEGTARSARTIAVLSPDYLNSQYGTAEWLAAWGRDPDGALRKLLVVRVADCERPGLLRDVVGVDLFGTAEAVARASLRRMVTSAVQGRMKPDERPAFPESRAVTLEPRFPLALPSIWRVPSRIPNFTGRASELMKLNQMLTSRQSVAVTSIRGPAGVGKSRLAIEYAHIHAVEYDLVYTIAAKEPAVISEEFDRLASQLGLGELRNTKTLQDHIHTKLSETPGWLLIFDNADAVEDIKPWIPSKPMPAGIPGHVVVTTQRHGEFMLLGEVLDLEPMNLPDAIRLLRVRMPKMSKDTAREIATELDRLPLALEQASAYMDKTRIDPPRYLALLRQRSADRYDKGWVLDRDDTGGRNIARQWDISLERIRVNPAAVELMDLCAYLAPEPIPLGLFSRKAGLLPPSLASAAAEELEFNDAIGILVDFSLVKRTASGLQVHRLVQRAVRRRHRLAQDSADISLAASPRFRVEALLAADNPGAPTDPATWPRWARLLPHLLNADVAASLNAELRATGCDACAYMLARGEAQGCADLTERLLDGWRPRLGDDDEDVLTIAIYRARALAEIRPVASVVEMAEITFGRLAATLGEDHPLTLTAANDLAGYFRAAGNARHALDLDSDTYSRRQRIFGEDDPDTLTSASNIASDLNLQDKKEEALERDKETLVRRRKVLGSDHLDTLKSAGNVAADLSELGDIQAARELAQDTVERRCRVQGTDHPDTLRASVNLAANLSALGEIAEAMRLIKDTFTRLKRFRGDGHDSTLGCAVNMAAILDDAGKTLAAKELAEETLPRCRAQLGEDNHITRACAHDLDKYVRKLSESH